MDMGTSRAVVILAVVAGVILLVVSALYFVEPAHSLPSFFPGHVGANSSEYAHHHTKHGIAALVVGIGCFIFAWFATGPKSQAAPPADAQA
jgi:formate hydrogenlyase subunit 4